ncbi:hypothetical protein AB0N81_11335 [Streptomyces sp. NPDC093510]
MTDALPVETCHAVPEADRTGVVRDFLDIATTTLRGRGHAVASGD